MEICSTLCCIAGYARDCQIYGAAYAVHSQSWKKGSSRYSLILSSRTISGWGTDAWWMACMINHSVGISGDQWMPTVVGKENYWVTWKLVMLNSQSPREIGSLGHHSHISCWVLFSLCCPKTDGSLLDLSVKYSHCHSCYFLNLALSPLSSTSLSQQDDMVPWCPRVFSGSCH